MDFNQISLNPSAIARKLVAVASLLFLISTAGQIVQYASGNASIHRLANFFYIDAERNIPTYFSVLLLLSASLLLAIIAVLNRAQRLPHAWAWAIISVGFLVMAFDESFQSHEKLIRPLQKLLGGSHLGIFYFTWVIPGIAIVLLLGLIFLKFLLNLPAPTRLRFLIAATLYLGGVIGLELIGGRHAELHGYKTWTYKTIATVEECLEIAGLIVFIWALLKYCADNYKEVRLRFEG